MARFKKKKDEDVNWAGRIISLLFLIIFAAGIYFIVNLFKSVPVDEISISGQWQLAGNPKWFLTINADGTASSFEQYSAGKTENNLTYTYTLTSKEDEDINGTKQDIYFINLKETKLGGETTIKITKVSRAEMAVYIDGKFKNLTKVGIF